MITYFPRGAFTAYLLEQLGQAFLVGDGEAPVTGGWDDDPNDPASSYAPYVVLNPLSSGEATGSLGDSNSEQRLSYSFTAYGISREQCEFYADLARKTAVNLERTVVNLDENAWKILQARANSIGGISRDDRADPSEFSQSDVVIVYLSKEL